MAALDFGMAMARGMLPTSEKAQKDLINLAGGRNIFKSEDWWNTQVDKQISKGYREESTQKQYLVDTGLARGGITPQASGVKEYRPGTPSNFGGMIDPPKGALSKPTVPIVGRTEYITRTATGFGFSDPKYFTAGELSDIERSAEAGAKRAKRETEAAKKSSKRARRGTSGLAGKARPVGAEVVTGLPELGSGGLQIGATTLGKGLLV